MTQREPKQFSRATAERANNYRKLGVIRIIALTACMRLVLHHAEGLMAGDRRGLCVLFFENHAPLGHELRGRKSQLHSTSTTSYSLWNPANLILVDSRDFISIQECCPLAVQFQMCRQILFRSNIHFYGSALNGLTNNCVYGQRRRHDLLWFPELALILSQRVQSDGLALSSPPLQDQETQLSRHLRRARQTLPEQKPFVSLSSPGAFCFHRISKMPSQTQRA